MFERALKLVKHLMFVACSCGVAHVRSTTSSYVHSLHASPMALKLLFLHGYAENDEVAEMALMAMEEALQQVRLRMPSQGNN